MPPTPRTPGSTTHKPAEFKVVFEFPGGGTRTVTVSEDEHVLAAARRAGLALPSLCEQGWDLACAVRVLQGELDHSDARRYYEEDRRAGFALICTAKPRSDLRLRTYQTAAMRRHRDECGLPAPRGT
jgi:ferredoxin